MKGVAQLDKTLDCPAVVVFLLQTYDKQTEHNMLQLFSMLINFNLFIL